MGGDHREPVSKCDDYRRIDSGQLLREHDMLRHLSEAAVGLVIPVDPPQVRW